MRQSWIGQIRCWLSLVPALALVVAFALAAGFSLPASVARAAAYDTSGYSITLRLNNGPSFTYGVGNTPDVWGTMTVPAGVSPDQYHLSIEANGVSSLGAEFLSHSGNTWPFRTGNTDWSQYIVGTNTVIATYDTGSGTVQSAPLTFTINRPSTQMMCSIQDSGAVYSPGQSLHILMQPTDLGGSGGVDWQNATYTVSFAGPASRTDADLKPDSNDQVTAVAPSQIGRYTLTCTFNGTANFAPSSNDAQKITISLKKPLAGAHLYTNPTTLQYNQNWQAYIVLQGQSGAPAPTGYFNVDVDRCISRAIAVGSNGDTLVNLGPITTLCAINQIQITYDGDPYYNSALFTFPQTNPPIPFASQGGSPGSGSSGHATPTPRPKPTATPTPTATAEATSTPTTVTPVNTVASVPPSSGTNPWLWVVAALVVVGLGGGIGGSLFIRARPAKAATKLVGGAASSTQPIAQNGSDTPSDGMSEV